jgi:hypothetical protein
MDIKELKAQTYDILLQIEMLHKKLQEINQKIAAEKKEE